jgi:hypothetical protein
MENKEKTDKNLYEKFPQTTVATGLLELSWNFLVPQKMIQKFSISSLFLEILGHQIEY